MTTYSNQYYATVFYFEFCYLESTWEGHWVKISYQPTTINQTVLSSPREYETRHYLSANQAFMHARGWVDCMLCYQSINQIPNDNKDFYEKTYRKVLDQLENDCSQEDLRSSQVSKQERNLAYWDGWKSKEKELNNMQIRNPE